MRRTLLLVSVLLCPVLAIARSPYDASDPDARFSLGVGLGGGSIRSSAPAPSAGRDTLGFSIDLGYRVAPEWGIGLDFGWMNPHGGCGGLSCTPANPDFAPGFSHTFLTGEFRPNNGGLRLRAGVGVTSMCYRHYLGRVSFWDKLVDALLFENYDSSDVAWNCKSLTAPGVSASIGYQWTLPDSRTSVGLQLRGETAKFAASANAGTPAFRHRAVLMQVQLSFN